MQAIVRSATVKSSVFVCLLMTLFFVGIGGKSWGQFTSGNIVVLQAGDGTAALNNNSTPIFLKEFTTSGTSGVTVTIPSSGSSALTMSGSATSEGLITLSSDRTYIVIPGFNALSGIPNIASSSSSTYPRAIGKVTSASTFTLATTTTSFSAADARGAASNGTNYWGSGANSGIVLESPSGGAGTVVSNTIPNTRALAIYNGNLYFTTNSGTTGFYQVGSGLPTTSGNSSIQLFTYAGTSPYQFAINAAGTVIYIADDSKGIYRYTLSGSTWTATLINTTVKGSGLTVDFSGTNPIIYATTTTTLYKLTDNGGSSISATSLVTAPANTAFRGIAFAPVAASCTAPTLSTVADLNECANQTNSLSVTATPSTGVTYQWYSNTAKLNTGGTAISTNGTSATYTPPSNVNGTFYYYVIASTGSTCNTTSNVATVTIGTTIALTSAANTNSQTVAPGGTIIPITYSIGNTGTGASISPALPTGLTGSYNAGVYTISGTAPTTPVNYSYTVTASGGCGNNPTATGTINISCTTAPSTQANNITFSGVQTNAITATWTNGGGNGRLVYVQTGSSSFPNPTGTPGTPNTVYSSGTQLVYNGTGNSVTVTGLTSGTTYYFRVYEYSNCSGTYVYNTTTATNNPNSATAQATVVQSGFISVLTPQYMVAASTANDRLPVMFQATVTGLTASTTYRYIVQGATSADFGGATTGAGNPLLVSSDGTSYTYVSNPPLNTLSTAGTYETFTTDGSGNYTGWFGFLNTSNVRFSVDSTIYPTIRIGDGATGSVLYQRALNVSVKPLAFGTTAAATNGSFFQSVTSAIPKNLVALFDNTSASGRPLFISPVENLNVTPSTYYTGSNLITGYSQTNGAWNAIIPNVNANGVRAIEQLSVTTGSLVGCIATDADGVWPTGPVSTVNPTNGSTIKIINGNDDPLVLATFSTQPAPSTTYCQNDAASALSVSTSGSVSGLQWYSNTTNSYTGGTPILNATGFSYTPSTTTPGTTYYYVQLTNSCGPVNSDFAKVIVNGTPIATFGTPTYTSCEGTPAQIIISGTTDAVVTYTINNGSPQQIILTGTSTTLNSVGSPANTYTYLITGVSLNNCNGTSGSTTTVTINALPTVAAITGPTNLPVGGDITIKDATLGGAWTIDLSGAAILGAITNTAPQATAALHGNAVGTSVVTYTITDPNTHCTNAVTSSINVYNASVASYRTKADGNFTDATIWEILAGGIWEDATTAPGNSNNVEIRHKVALNTDFSGTSQTSFEITSHGTGVNTVSGSLIILPTHFLSSTGGVNFNDDSVFIKSDATGSGAIGQVTNGSAISGASHVTVERYIPKKRAWRLITSPITDATINAAWQEGMLYDGSTYHKISDGSVTTPPTDFGTMITGYGQGTAANANSHGYDYWSGVANTTSSIRYYVPGPNTGSWSNSLPTISGVKIRDYPAYMLFVRGDRSVTTDTSATTLRATGTLLQGPANIGVIHGGNVRELAGNPYASAIDFAQVYSQNSILIQNKFAVWVAHLGSYGAYSYIYKNGSDYSVIPFTEDGTGGGTQTTPAGAQFIQSGEGFLVYPFNNSVSGTLTLTEAAKAPTQQATSTTNTFREEPVNDKKLWVNLNLENTDGTTVLADGMLARFDNLYSSDIDDDDATKPANFNENWGILSHNTDLIVEARPDVQKTDTVHMKLWNMTQRAYQLQVKGDNWTSSPGVHAYLVDNYLQTKQEVSLSGSLTTVDFTVTTDSASWKSDRFSIVFQNDAVALPLTLTSVKAAPQNGGVSVTWTVTNEVNIKGYTVERSTNGGQTYSATGSQQAARNNGGSAITSYSGFDAAPQMGSNLYRIRIESKDGTVSYSKVVTVVIGGDNGKIQITLYPNPVRQNGKVSLQLTNLKTGTYLASVYSSAGQTVYQQKITIAQANTTQSEELRLGSALAQGSYEVRLTDNKGTILYADKLLIGK